MNNYPFEIHEIASKVDRLAFKQVHTWDALQMVGLPLAYLDEMLLRRAAGAIAHEFVGKVLKHMSIQRSDEPEGRVLRVNVVALSYDELLELLYQAYAEGQSDGMNRRITKDQWDSVCNELGGKPSAIPPIGDSDD
jgi:hypothetical protein